MMRSPETQLPENLTTIQMSCESDPQNRFPETQILRAKVDVAQSREASKSETQLKPPTSWNSTQTSQTRAPENETQICLTPLTNG